MSLKINEQIITLRKRKGITQGELADVLGVSNQSVSKWESGQCCPDIQLLPELARYFEVSVDALMGIEIPKKEPETEKTSEITLNINDPLLRQAVELLGKRMLISTSVLQRKIGVGYLKAKELIETMQSQGYIVEIRPGFYQATHSKQDQLKTLVKTAVKEREDMLNIAQAMHAVWFLKMQQAESSVESAVDAVLGGQWGYSAFIEPNITTVMRGQSVFYSSNRALDFNQDRVERICALMRTLSDRRNLTVLAALYVLTVYSEDAFVGIHELIGQSRLSQEEVQVCLEGDLAPHILAKDQRYRVKGEDMAILPILSILCP